MGGFVKKWKMGGCKKWKMGGVLLQKNVENGGVFFCKKWTFPQSRVHYVQYQYFLFYILLIGGTYAPTPLPTGLLCAVCPAAETERSGRTGGDVILMSSLILVCVCIIISVAILVLLARRRRPTNR